MIDCPAEEFIPVPVQTNPLLIKKSYAEVFAAAKAACNAMDLLVGEGYEKEEQDEDEQSKAVSKAIEVGKEVITNGSTPAYSLNDALSTPESVSTIATLLKEYDFEVQNQVRSLRNYITNRLVLESDHPDPKIRMDALKTLGKIGGVDLFVERKEVIVQNKSTVELENTLRNKLKVLMSRNAAQENAENATYTPTKPPILIENELAGLIDK